MRSAGCSLGDVENLVHRDGLEGALHTLMASGVYLDFDELRGARPTVRGSTTIQVRLDRLVNPRVADGLLMQRGARNRVTGIRLDEQSLLDYAVHESVYLHATGSDRRVRAQWAEPGSSTFSYLMRCTVAGQRWDRWFSQLDPSAGDHDRYMWSARCLHWMSLLAQRPIPAPEYAPIEHPDCVLDWAARTLGRGQAPDIVTYPSSAIRLAECAAARGVRLDGLRFTLRGEAVTPARLRAMEDTGAEAIVTYNAHEAGNLARGCLDRAEADEVHLLDDLHVIVQPGSEGPRLGMRPNTLLLSSLNLTFRFFLITAYFGDEGIVSSRQCGCPWQEVGWTTHIHNVRSYEKMTAGGMTFVDRDLARILEEVLPRQFGGGPLDYQLISSSKMSSQTAARCFDCGSTLALAIQMRTK
jgi:hypothetical protein